MIYASLWQRFWALVIDFCLFCIVFFPTTRIVKGVWLMGRGDHLWNYGALISDPLCLVFLLIMILYFVILEGLYGRTLGKKLTGLKVVTLEGQRPGLVRSFIRNLLRLIDGLPFLNILGVILIIRSSQNARLGDHLAETRVILSR